MGIKHAFTDPKADGGDETVVRPSDWNGDHAVTHIDLPTEATPANPASGYVRLYAGTDKMLHARDETGDEGSPASGGVFPVVAVFDGGGSAITGNPEVDVVMPAAGTLTGYTLLADASGSAVIDVWSDTYGNFPPTDGDSITASAPPTLSSAAKATDSTLTGWDKALAAGDILRFHVDSATTVKRLVLTLTYTRS